MIYILDIPNSEHCEYLTGAIGMFSETKVTVVTMGYSMTIHDLVDTFSTLAEKVYPGDIVLVPWHIPRDESVNFSILRLTERCFVVAAAGNTAESVEFFTPTSVPSVITVGALNKSGNPAGFSSRSAFRDIKWAPGTNIMVNGQLRSGTSVAAAIYAAVLANAIDSGDLSQVTREIDRIRGVFYSELGY